MDTESKPQANDFVFSYETRLGQAAIIPEDFECCLGRRMGLVRFDPSKVNSLYFVYQYVSPSFRAFLETKIVRGATVDRISIKRLSKFPILVPSLSEQERIAEEIGSFRIESQRLESIYRQKIAALDELKKALLHKAFAEGTLILRSAGQSLSSAYRTKISGLRLFAFGGQETKYTL